MKNQDNYGALQFILSLALFMGAGISNLLRISKSDVWICIILGTILGFIILKIFSKLNNKGLKITSYISNIVILFFGLFSTTKLISSIYLSSTPSYIIMIPNILLIIYTVKQGFNAFLRSTNTLFIFLLILILSTAFMLLPGIEIDYFKPVMTSKINNILLGSLSTAITMTLPIVLIPNFKKYYKPKFYLYSAIILFIIIICTFGNLGVEMSALYRYPEYIVLKRISALNFIDNVENILFIIWIIIGFTSSTMSSLNVKKLYGNKVFYISIISLYLLISFWLIDSYKVIEFLTKHYLAILTSIMIVLLLSKIKKN